MFGSSLFLVLRTPRKRRGLPTDHRRGFEERITERVVAEAGSKEFGSQTSCKVQEPETNIVSLPTERYYEDGKRESVGSFGPGVGCHGWGGLPPTRKRRLRQSTGRRVRGCKKRTTDWCFRSSLTKRSEEMLS